MRPKLPLKNGAGPGIPALELPAPEPPTLELLPPPEPPTLDELELLTAAGVMTVDANDRA